MNKLFLLCLLFAAFVAVHAFGDDTPAPPVPIYDDISPANATMKNFLRWMEQWMPHTKMLPNVFQSIKSHEIVKRYKIWKENARVVWEHNQQANQTWQAGLNMFSHLTDDEFKHIDWGFKMPNDNVTTNTNMPPLTKRYNGREWKGTPKVRAVRDQGQCGSCWAFSAAAALEGGLETDINPQEIIDCAGLGACGGGDPIAAVAFGSKGLKVMSQYNGGRYDARQENCKGGGNLFCSSNVRTVRSSRDSDLDQLINLGPVSVCINADGLKNYRSGIATAPCSPGCNHAVTATGYNDQYYEVKNSWGTGFGEGGYFKFPHGSNHCGISGYCSQPQDCRGGGSGSSSGSSGSSSGGSSGGNHGVDRGVDRPGWDLPNQPQRANDWQDCRHRCQNDGNCKVFVFNSCGNDCWLKGGVPGTQGNGCRISGIVRN